VCLTSRYSSHSLTGKDQVSVANGRVLYSKSWKLVVDGLSFFIIRFICTHIIAYRVIPGAVWPDTGFISIAGVPLHEIQYQVSAYSGVIFLIFIYWAEQRKTILAVCALLFLLLSIFLELSWRITYCTGKIE
jgi:hypothetical protein